MLYRKDMTPEEREAYNRSRRSNPDKIGRADPVRVEIAAQAYAKKADRRDVADALGLSRSGQRAGAPYDIAALPEVQQRAAEIVRTRFLRNEITADRVMTELARVAFSTAKDLFDKEGNLTPIQDMEDDAASTIVGFDVESRPGRGKNATSTTITKVRRADKMAALGILAKHFKIVAAETDGVNALASALADRLDAAKRRIPVPQDVQDANIIQPGEAEGFAHGAIAAPTEDLGPQWEAEAAPDHNPPSQGPSQDSSDETELW